MRGMLEERTIQGLNRRVATIRISQSAFYVSVDVQLQLTCTTFLIGHDAPRIISVFMCLACLC